LKSEEDARLRRQAAAAERQTRVTRFVNNYEGGDCFFVTPTLVAEDQANLEGYGSSLAPFQALDTEFKRANGFEAMIGLHQVTPPQCAAVTFLSRVRNQPGRAPRLDIGSPTLKSGSALTGTVADFGGRNVDLVLVADDGAVYNLSGKLTANGDAKSFTVSMPPGDAAPGQPQLLFAVVTDKPLAALQSPKPGGADEVFARAVEEARNTGQALNVAAKYFKLEK